MSTKPFIHKVGVWFMWSAIPFFGMSVAALAAAALMNFPDTEGNSASAAAGFFLVVGLFCFLPAVVLGISLQVCGNIQFGQAVKQAMGYAEANGWRPLSKVSFFSKKRDTDLRVNPSMASRSFVLTIESDETIAVTDCGSALLAMQFADWLLESSKARLTREYVDSRRAVWVDMLALPPGKA